MYPPQNDFTNISAPAAPPGYNESIYKNDPSQFKSREERFREIIEKHEISVDFSQRLQQLQGFKIVFIFDDSGSMNAPYALIIIFLFRLLLNI